MPTLAREILSLFEGALAEQRFGELDRTALEALAEQTREQGEKVQAAREALDEARAALEGSRSELVRCAEQGLAYARVFARGDAELMARIEALEVASAPKKKSKTKRRTAKKAPAQKPDPKVAELPFEQAS